jgi:hypothetical protein
MYKNHILAIGLSLVLCSYSIAGDTGEDSNPDKKEVEITSSDDPSEGIIDFVCPNENTSRSCGRLLRLRHNLCISTEGNPLAEVFVDQAYEGLDEILNDVAEDQGLDQNRTLEFKKKVAQELESKKRVCRERRTSTDNCSVS